jgi:hypothetical protein
MNTTQEWRDEFDREFVNYFGSKDRQAIRVEYQENPQAIKDFIQKTLDTHTAHLVERMAPYLKDNPIEQNGELIDGSFYQIHKGDFDRIIQATK